MQTQQMLLSQSFHQRKGQQRLQYLIEAQRISHGLPEHSRPAGCSTSQQFFRNVTGREIGPEPQQFGRSRMGLLNPRKGERPGGCHAAWIIAGLFASTSQQTGAMLLIELEIVPKATSS